MLYYLIPLIYLAGLGSAMFAVMSTRTAQGAIAWVVCLVTFPYLAVPAYWVFGRNKFRGYLLARQEHLALVHERLASATAELHQTARLAGTVESQLRSTERLARAGDGRQQNRSACPMERRRSPAFSPALIRPGAMCSRSFTSSTTMTSVGSSLTA